MRASAQTIINYFSENFAFLEELFRVSKKDNFYIISEILISRCNAYNIPVKKLYKFSTKQIFSNIKSFKTVEKTPKFKV